jgi:DNA-binding MarR family transcriptional regulator
MSPGLDFLVEQWRRERPDIDLSAFVIAGTIKLIDHQAEAEFRRLASKFGIGPGDLRILLALRRSGVDNPKRPTDLFQSLIVTSGAVTKQVDRLVARGLVKRGADPSYQRGSLVRLTARGAKVADTAIQAICTRETSIGAAVANLSEEDRELGKRFLQRLLAQFDSLSSPEASDTEYDREAETAD